MSNLELETLAIVNAMLPQVEARQAALTLRMWHHLSSATDRELLFGAFAEDGTRSLLQALLSALPVRLRREWPTLRTSARLCHEHGPQLEQAFRLAFIDVLGDQAGALVANAWQTTFHDFWSEMCHLPHGG